MCNLLQSIIVSMALSSSVKFNSVTRGRPYFAQAATEPINQYKSSDNLSAIEVNEKSVELLSNFCEDEKSVELTSSLRKTLSFENITNFRDLATNSENKIPARSIYRSGYVYKASQSDQEVLVNDLRVRTLIDLRSYAESKGEDFHTGIYSNFEVSTKLNKIGSETRPSSNIYHSIPLVSEKSVIIEVFKRMNLFKKVKIVAVALPSMFSARVKRYAQKLFAQEINSGGLGLLYEVMLKLAGPQIVSVLKILADKSNHPTILYCTAGKDRTGLISMLVQHICGVSEDMIIEEYTLSKNAYDTLQDSNAAIASLRKKYQDGLNTAAFYDAPKDAIVHAMNYLKEKYGSIEGYLDLYGFDNNWREKMRRW